MDVEIRVPHRGIVVGLMIGALTGGLANVWGMHPGPPPQPEPWLKALVHYLLEPLGRIFLNLLLMTVVPLVFTSLVVGVGRLGGLDRLGQLGVRTITYFLLTTTSAVCIGLGLVQLVQPGRMLDDTIVSQLQAVYGRQEAVRPAEFGIQQIVQMVPRNPLQAAVEMNMLAIIVFALLFGIGLQRVSLSRRQMLTTVLEAIADVMVAIIGLALWLAPLGVFALIFSTVAQFGFSLLVALGVYVGVVLVGLAVQLLVVFPLLIYFLGRRSPGRFFLQIRLVLLTAFSTSSSNATLPASLRTAQTDLGISPPVAGFVLPLGATMNMNGTALFEGVTVLFLAQVAGVELSWLQQVLVLILCVVTAIGAAGVPGGSIPLLAMVLAAVHVSPDYLFLILGVDRLLDMCRTTVNVTGDLIAAVYVQRFVPALDSISQALPQADIDRSGSGALMPSANDATD
ncbi:MAG: dicarboxylate/amino acid:cation symporter [Thermogemmata sp.]|nr:dicarboxylate/amino acid:cation symporter [Thermogemmata sp.]